MCTGLGCHAAAGEAFDPRDASVAAHVLPETPATDGAPASVRRARDPAAYEIGFGDKLQVKFFQRDELSGDFRVRSDGRITLPLIGSLEVEGLTPVELERLISSRFYAITNRSAFAVVDVIERRPFFVSGDVNRPGTFAYVPRMTVVHAVAIAGGLYRVTATPTQAMNVTREQWRLKSARADAATHLAKRERLKALLNRQDEVVFPSLISELVGGDQAGRIVRTQRRLFEQSRKWSLDQQDFLNTAVKLADEEIKALRTRLATINDVLKVHGSELETTQHLLRRGLTQRRSVYEKQYAISNLMTTAANVEAEIKRAELRRVQAVKAKAEFWPEQDRQLADKLAEMEDEFEASMRAIEASSSMIGQAGQSGLQAVGFNGLKAVYRILRRAEGRIDEIAASENDLVRPGDVLKVALVDGGRDPSGAKSLETRAGPGPAPEGSDVPTLLRSAARAASDASRNAFAQHIRDLKELMSQQTSILSTVARSQADLARKIEAWGSRPIEAADKSDSLAEPEDGRGDAGTGVSRASHEIPLQPAARPVRSPGAAASVAGGADDASRRDARDSVVLPSKGPVRELDARQLATVVQRELVRIGCYGGPIDGEWGPQSQQAMVRYGEATRLRVTTGRPSLRALGVMRDHSGPVCTRRQVATRATPMRDRE